MSQFILSETSTWQLKDADQDIRGWPVEGQGASKIGHVARLIADDETQRIERIVLDNGQELPADALRLGDRVVHLERPAAHTPTREAEPRATPETPPAAGPSDASEHHAKDDYTQAFREHYTETYAHTGQPYDEYAPAYGYGYEYGTDPAYKRRSYSDLEPEMRQTYEEKHGQGAFQRVEGAVRHAFKYGRSNSPL